MTCPNCSADVTDTRVGLLTACGACHRTLKEDGDVLIGATGADTADLTPSERAELIRLRARPKMARRFH